MTDQDMWKSAQYFNPLSLYRERRCFPRASIQRTRNFNPLSLYRERLQLLILQLFLFTFQSTLPIQGETLSVIRIFHHQPFQSTLPIQGETLLVIKTKLSFIFQSTLPIQGETSTSTTCSLYEKISIHSPYTGRDAEENVRLAFSPDISIHSPYTGRDSAPGLRVTILTISIHSPYTGRDADH